MGLLDLVSQALHWSIEQVKKDVTDYKTKKLIDEAFSARPSIKILARAQLKKDYPEVYAQLESLVEVK